MKGSDMNANMRKVLDWMMAPAVLALGCAIALRLAFSREWRQAVREEDAALEEAARRGF